MPIGKVVPGKGFVPEDSSAPPGRWRASASSCSPPS